MQHLDILETAFSGRDGTPYILKVYSENSETDESGIIKYRFEIYEMKSGEIFCSIDCPFNTSDRLDVSDPAIYAIAGIALCVARELSKFGVAQVIACYLKAKKRHPHAKTSKLAIEIANCLGGSGQKLVDQIIKAI